MKAHTSQSEKTILVVEDDATNLMVVCGYLEMMGYAYDVAKSGLEAIGKAKNNAYTAILLDIKLPDIDGIDVVTHLRNHEVKSNASHIPIIAISAHSIKTIYDLCRKAGVDDFIPKPYTSTTLRNILQVYI